MRIRVKDIAREAGVSAATVSNVLNGRGGAGEDTAQRVLSVARALGYSRERSSGGARPRIRLVMFKRHGLVVMDTQFFAELIEAIERQCHQCGMELMISHIHMRKDEDYRERIQAICEEDCAGILLLATEMYTEDLRLFDGASAPLLVLDSLFRHEPRNTVVMNNYEAGYMATQRLIRAGHTRIAHLTSSMHFNNMDFRREGYEAAMGAHGLEVSEDSVWQVTPTIEGAYLDMQALLRECPGGQLPTAFFAANDIIAVGSVRALEEQGLVVPRDVSVIGMDDLSIGQILAAPLSSVRVFREDIGRIAVLRLADMAREDLPQSVQKTEVGVALVERASVGAPRE